jgi:hypothetical protein
MQIAAARRAWPFPENQNLFFSRSFAMKSLRFVLLVLAVVSPALVSIALTQAASEEQIDNNWLNGKWEGRPPLGGELTMTLAVDKQNQIQGSAVIPGGGERGAHPQVTGSVKGKRVLLETFFPSARPQGSVHYNCIREDDALQCRTKSGYTTTFKRVE